jgi:thioredoxin-like negative regulator of GroEL
MRHLTNIYDIEQALADHRICLFYIKAPDCGVCNVMLDKVESIVTHFPTLYSIYTDITEEPLIAGRFLVYSGPTVLLFMEGKEVYRTSGFINLAELEIRIKQYQQV